MSGSALLAIYRSAKRTTNVVQPDAELWTRVFGPALDYSGRSLHAWLCNDPEVTELEITTTEPDTGTLVLFEVAGFSGSPFVDLAFIGQVLGPAEDYEAGPSPITRTREEAAFFIVGAGSGHAAKPSVVSTITASAATDLFHKVAHGYGIGDTVRFRTATGVLPAPITDADYYYIVASGFTADDFKVSDDPLGGAIDLTTDSVGTVNVHHTSSSSPDDEYEAPFHNSLQPDFFGIGIGAAYLTTQQRLTGSVAWSTDSRFLGAIVSLRYFPQRPAPLKVVDTDPQTWAYELRRPHRIWSKAELVTPRNAPLATFKVGQATRVDYSARSPIQTQGSGTLLSTELFPKELTDQFTPFQSQLRLWRGVYSSDGTVIYGRIVATLVLEEVDVSTGPYGTVVEWIGSDRAVLCTTPNDQTVTIPAGSPQDQILAVVTLKVPDFYFVNNTDSVHTVPAFTVSDNPWDDCLKVAAACAQRVYWTPGGRLALDELPKLTTLPTWSIGQDPELSARIPPLTFKRKMASRDVPSVIHYVSTGTGVDAPTIGVAYDANPQSPTYYRGPYGERVKTVTTSKALTQLQCDQAAMAQLVLWAGAADGAEATIIPNPALTGNQVVLTRVPATGADGPALVRGYSFTFDPQDAEDLTLDRLLEEATT